MLPKVEIYHSDWGCPLKVFICLRNERLSIRFSLHDESMRKCIVHESKSKISVALMLYIKNNEASFIVVLMHALQYNEA